MNLIFLDIDGVLNCKYTIELVPNTKIIGIDDDKLERLRKIVDITNSYIILISTWKIDWNYIDDKDNQNKYGDYLDDKFLKHNMIIYDKTSDNSYDRGHGIISYLNNCKNINNYIILDNDIYEDYNDELLAHLIKTDSLYGITDDNVMKAIELLKNKKEK